MHTVDLTRWQHERVFLGDAHRKNERRAWAAIALTAAMMVVELAECLCHACGVRRHPHPAPC